MPDIKVFYPEGMLDAAGAKQDFKEDAAAVASIALDCNDYNGNPIDLEFDAIDVLLVAYAPEDNLNGAPVRVEVAGYDYPDRMDNIQERLVHIKTSLCRKVQHCLELDEKVTAVTVSFIRISDGCWA